MSAALHAVAPGADRAAFAVRVAAAWRQALDSVIDTGKALVAAKAALKHGEFEAMVESDLPFGRRTAQMLMAIARDERITAYARMLPPHWATLYELTTLDEPSFAAALRAGAIRPDMDRKDAAALRRADHSAGPDGTPIASPPLPRPVADTRYTSFGKPIVDCDRAELQAELARLPRTQRLIEALLAEMPPRGTVHEVVPESTVNALLKAART